MKKILFSTLMALTGLFAISAQYILMMENRTTSFSETTIRFFSYFTILTNLLVAFYFTGKSIPATKKMTFINKPGLLTALTVYITVVGLIYQLLLRFLWNPEGLQWVVDELLHSVIPLLTIVYWFFYEIKQPVRYQQIASWIVYPLLYLLYILVRGNSSGFYPYPFIDVSKSGLQNVLINAGYLLLLFIGLSAAYIFIGKKITHQKYSD